MLENGVTVMYKSYLRGTKNSRLLIVVSRDLTEEFNHDYSKRVIRQLEKLSTKVVCKNSDSIRLKNKQTLKFIAKFDIVLIVAKTSSELKKDLLSYLQARDSGPKIFRLFDYSEEVFKFSFLSEQSALDELNKRLIATGKGTKSVKVKSCSGTDLKIDFVKGYEWTNSCGYFDQRYPGVLPPGEVNTYSPAINGVLVGDGAINFSIGIPFLPLLKEDPLQIEIMDSKVVDYQCENPFIKAIFAKFLTIPNAHRVGEVGFGTNEKFKGFVNFCSHINERHPGLHLGLGTPTQTAKCLDWSCPLHMDIIPNDSEIYFDDALIFSKGLYNTNALADAKNYDADDKILNVDAL